MIEKCADEGDMATQRETLANEQAQIRHQQEEAARIKATKTALASGDFDGKHCIVEDCGDELPPLRLAEHRMMCTSCQSRRETQSRQRGVR